MMCEYEGDWGSMRRGGERGWGWLGGWEREVGIGGGRGVFWNFFFFEKRGGGVWRGGMVGLGVSLGAVLGEWV